MEDLLKQQLEALEVIEPYCGKISRAIDNVIKELNGNRQDDTDEYVRSIQNGLNWIIEVYNGTRTLVNKDSVVIDKDVVNAAISRLNAANNAKNDAMLADAFAEVKVFVETFAAAAHKLVANQ